MKAFYDVIGYSVANFGKEKNGDSFLFERLEEENLIIAAVADGVSQQPCDWLASSTTCTALIAHFKNNISQSDIAKRLTESIIQTGRDVASTDGQCRKMASTLSVVVCSQTLDKFYYANIGDSRIYRLCNGNLQQLTTDDVLIRKERVLTEAGMRVIDKCVLTKVIGQDSIAIKIHTESIQADEVLFLATDGFYEARKAIFNKLMIEFGEIKEFEEGFTRLVDQVKMLRGDDLTALAIKRGVGL